MTSADRFDLERFVTAQAPVFETVLAELRAGRKRTHWMWFVFPQLSGLGRSSTARLYPAGDAPVHRSFEPVRQRAAGLGYRRVEEVGPDSGRRVHPEQQNENRRHKGAAAYSGQSNEHADNEAGHD